MTLIYYHILNESDNPEDHLINKVEDNTFDIVPELIPELLKKLDTLNKKAGKIGVPPITIEQLGTKIIEKTREDANGGGKYNVKIVTIRINGQRPRVAGWDFLATVEGTEHGNILRVAPGAEKYQTEIQSYYNSDPGMCQWCKKRRARTETFIVRKEETGELKQVGRNCLKDFLGGKSPQMIASMFEGYDDLYSFLSKYSGGEEDDESMGRMGGRRSERYLPVDDVLLAGVVAARLFGYKPSSFEGQTTAYLARLLTFNPPDPTITTRYGNAPNPEYGLYQQMKTAISDQDKQTVQQIKQWFNSLPESKKQEPYFHNVNVMFKENHITSRNVGYVVGLIPSYSKSLGQQFYQKKEGKSNEWIGTPGQKLPPTKVKVIRTKILVGPYGQTQIATMEDEKGNVLVWFNNSASRMEEGEDYTLTTATIKGHDEYNGRKQTQITRAKFQ